MCFLKPGCGVDLFSITNHFRCCLGPVDLFIVFFFKKYTRESVRFDCQPGASFLLRNEMPRPFAAGRARHRYRVLTNLRGAQTDSIKAARLFFQSQCSIADMRACNRSPQGAPTDQYQERHLQTAVIRAGLPVRLLLIASLIKEGGKCWGGEFA